MIGLLTTTKATDGNKGEAKPLRIGKSAARNWQRNAKQWATKSRGFDAGNFSTNGAIDFVVNG